MGKVLRDYQILAQDEVKKQLAQHPSTLLVLPTGMGKTVVMASIASTWERGNVLLLAHRVELLDQAADKLEVELGYRPVIEQAERGIDTACLWQGGAVLVGSVQTMVGERRLAKFTDFPFDLILVDEAHHATAPSYARIISHFRALNASLKVLGVTATPRRADETALGLVFDSVAFDLAIADAVELGWLVPVEQDYVAMAEVDFDAIGTSQNDMGEADLKASELEARMVEEKPLHALARPILDAARGRPCLVFTAGVAHAHLLADVLNGYQEGQGKAAAVDGKTDKQVRAGIVRDFASGSVQFLCNFGVFTEGFDVPQVGVVAMGRPTKSIGLYTQMLGRGTRPLPGVVDGPPTPEARRAAIAMSAKPHLSVLDFVGNSRHKLVSSVDVLGGNYDVETRDLARRRIASQPGTDVMGELKKARAEITLLREQARRRALKAQVSYSTERVDPFAAGPGPAAGELEMTRGGSTDAQIGLLVNLGVPREVAAGYGKGQAGAVIESLKKTRCTNKQRAILARYGEPTDVNSAEAGRIIDAIARNGWKPRPEAERGQVA